MDPKIPEEAATLVPVAFVKFNVVTVDDAALNAPTTPSDPPAYRFPVVVVWPWREIVKTVDVSLKAFRR